jgi:hypothetical protein
VERLRGLSPAAIHELACYIDELERNDILTRIDEFSIEWRSRYRTEWR